VSGWGAVGSESDKVPVAGVVPAAEGFRLGVRATGEPVGGALRVPVGGALERRRAEEEAAEEGAEFAWASGAGGSSVRRKESVVAESARSCRETRSDGGCCCCSGVGVAGGRSNEALASQASHWRSPDGRRSCVLLKPDLYKIQGRWGLAFTRHCFTVKLWCGSLSSF